MNGNLWILTLLVCFVTGCASLASTSTDLSRRQDQLSSQKCALTYERALNFIKYFPPGSTHNYSMYDPDKMGFRTYDLLGDIYYGGCAAAGVTADKAAAIIWYQYAAVKHLPEAQWKLGRMLYEGDGVAKDVSMGLSWLTSAAIEGSPEAAEFLRAHNEPVPAPITPDTYEILAQQAKNDLQEARAAQRAKAVQDLASLIVGVAAVYVEAKAINAATTWHAPPTVYSPYVRDLPQPSMTRPVYCTYYATANSMGDTVFARVNAFCN